VAIGNRQVPEDDMTDISFRDIATHMDCLYPPTSMRDLLGRFRYPDVAPGSLPSPPNSFREVATRIVTETNPKIAFIHYNTWLLEPRFDLETLIKSGALVVLGGPPSPAILHFVVCVVGDVVRLLEKALESIDADDICDTLFPPIVEVCGVSVNPANDACKLAAAATTELADFLINNYFDSAEDALEWLFDHFEWGYDWAVDIILELTGLNLSIAVKSKPQMDERAVEIGKEVFSYDWVSLCEVWDSARRGKILSQGPAVTSFTGPSDPPPGDWQTQGSGLLVFSPTFPLQGGGVHTYQTTGVHRMVGDCDLGALVDSDIWARKGIQLTILEAGNARIDLYTTHLYSGGDMLDLPILNLPEPTDGEKADVRKSQGDELVEFIRETHDPRHIAIVAGDFNIPAASETAPDFKSPEYDELLGKLSHFLSSFPGFVGQPVEFDDWWSLSMFQNVFPQNVDFKTQGHTNRHGDGDDPIFDTFDSICKIFPMDQEKPESPNENDFYCDERVKSDEKPTGERIDYIFIERPTELHSFMLDVSRIRRRAFKRSGIHTEPQFFLSDHLGLEVSLFVSPKP
jgi:exonuclease III